jgi:hypothetical protein
MKVVIKHLDNFEKPFVVNSVNHVIAAADTHLAKCIGENANWQPMRDFRFSPKWTEGFAFSDRTTHILGTNPFTDIGSFRPGPSEKRKLLWGERFNQQTRAFSLLNPSRIQEGTNLLGVTEINFDLVTMLMTPRRVDRAVLYTLSVVSQAGWKVDETFVRFTLSKELVKPDSKIHGVILGTCNNWLEALFCATLISAGYFVMCYDPESTPSPYYPAMMDVVRFGMHPLYFNGGLRCLSYVYVDDICYPKTTKVLDELNPDNQALIIMSRAKELEEDLAHCGLYSFDFPAPGELRKIKEKAGGTNLAIHNMPSAKQFGALNFSESEYFTDSVSDATNLVNFSVGEIFGFGLNEYDPKVNVKDFGMRAVRVITNDAFDEDVKAGELYDDITRFSDEKVVLYEFE